MTSNFEKVEYSNEFDYRSEIIERFNRMGFSKVKVVTSTSNGLSHYVYLTVDVLDEGKCWYGMLVEEGKADITVRISDHDSSLEYAGGVNGDRMTFSKFLELIKNGAIKSSN